MNKLICSFQKVILFLSFVCFLLIWGGTFAIAQKDFFTRLFGTGHRILLLITAVVLLLLAVLAFFRHFDSCSNRRLMCYSGIFFLIITIIFIILMSLFRIVPINDSHSIMDQALSMAQSGEKPMSTEGIYANYFSKYSNNYALALLFMVIFQMLERIGIADVYTPFFLLNMLCLLAGVFFTWLIARKSFGLRAAVKVLFLSMLNPVYYLMVFWVYSNTLSIPFMMGLIYIGLCIYSAKNFRTRCLLGILGAAICVIGFELRPTAVIPLIALFVCFLFYIGRHRKDLLKWLGIFVLSTTAAGMIYLAIGNVCNSYFYTVSEGNYPVTHWLMMGSHNNGRYNVADDRFTFSYETAEEKKEATLSQIQENLQELGAAGILKLIPQKIVTTWSDGYFAMELRLNQNMRYSRLYSWLVTEKSDLFHLYCQSFWFVTVFLILISSFHQLHTSTMGTIPFLLILSLFGGILFYCFWEVKEAYAIPFLPIFYLLAADGGGRLQNFTRKIAKKPVYTSHIVYTIRGISITMMVLCSSLTVDMYQNLKNYEMIHNDYSIRCSSFTWMKSLPVENGDRLAQEFYPDSKFNEITLRAIAEDTDGQNDCQYQVSLTDDTGSVVYTATITADDIQENRITLSTGLLPASPEGGYVLTLTKQTGKYGDILLRTRKGICLDTYQGSFRINGMTQGNDLYMCVSHTFTAPYCRPQTAAVLCFGGWLVAMGILARWLFTTFSSSEEPA